MFARIVPTARRRWPQGPDLESSGSDFCLSGGNPGYAAVRHDVLINKENSCGVYRVLPVDESRIRRAA
ncbi:hypothetical protein BO443_20008 [Burkholderia orbicola]